MSARVARLVEKPKLLGGVTSKGFLPGKSGNPSGRPAIASRVRELCRQNAKGTIEDVIAEIYAMALAPGDSPTKLAAAMYLVDRVAGKPTLAVAGEDGAPLGALIFLPSEDPNK